MGTKFIYSPDLSSRIGNGVSDVEVFKRMRPEDEPEAGAEGCLWVVRIDCQ